MVTDVSLRTTFRLAVRSSAGFIDKLGSALGYDETDHLGWLLTESATPRYPSNPYVRLTRDRQLLDDGETGTSLESSLADRIAASGGDLQPNDVLKHLAVADVDGDVLDVRCSRWM